MFIIQNLVYDDKMTLGHFVQVNVQVEMFNIIKNLIEHNIYIVKYKTHNLLMLWVLLLCQLSYNRSYAK